MLEVLFQNEVYAHSEQHKLERCLVKLRRMHGMRKVGKLYAEEAVGFLSVTAPCKKATDTSECVGNQNTTREQRNDFIQPCRVFLSEYEIYREETSNTSDKTSDKCHSASQLKAHRWIFYVVIGRLEQRGKAKADNNGCDSVIK